MKEIFFFFFNEGIVICPSSVKAIKGSFCHHKFIAKNTGVYYDCVMKPSGHVHLHLRFVPALQHTQKKVKCFLVPYALERQQQHQ